MKETLRAMKACGCAALLCLLAAASGLRGEEIVEVGDPHAFYAVKLSDLGLPADVWQHEGSKASWQVEQAMRPRVVLDGPGEAYVAQEGVGPGMTWSVGNDSAQGELVVRIDGPAREVKGRLWLANADYTGMTARRFTLPASAAKADSLEAFYKAKIACCEDLCARQVPGTAYYRHEALATWRSLRPTETAPAPVVNQGWSPSRPESLGETYALFSGGRAVAENLQLDRAFRGRPTDVKADVAIDTIDGITVKPYDWKGLVKEVPALDPLASLVPEDQHAIFFSSFAAFRELLEQADGQSLPVLQLTEPRSEDGMTKERYEKQLGLSVTALGKLLGPELISSVAVTGSDPYLRMGSDVAILFEAKGDAAALEKVLALQIAMQTGLMMVKAQGGPAGPYMAITTPDRTVSSYLLRLGNAVVVTNSPAELAILVAVSQGKTKALSTAPEYQFFRDRYKRGEDETGLLVLSDATIRRWCGPRVRIADARRTAALAVLSDIAATQMGDPKAKLVNPYPAVELGELTMTDAGARSSIYGSIGFMTPISELVIDKVTAQEQADYVLWRNGYQRGYRQYFDPIAARFTVGKERLGLDVTVMPLVEQSDYNTDRFLSVTKGARLRPDSGDPHGALAQVVMALNPKSPLLTEGGGFLMGMLKTETSPLSWVGNSVSVYADDDPFWADLAKAEDVGKFFETAYPRLPVALRVETSNPLKLAAFLVALRTYADQAAPNMVTWENRTHAGLSYVRIAPTEGTAHDDPALKELAIYYASTPDALVVSLSEGVIQRSLARYAATTQPAATRPATVPAAAPAAPPTTPAWLGQNVSAHVEAKLAAVLLQGMHKELLAHMQVLAWSNLPILNDLRRLDPKTDALQTYTRIWQTKLIDPGGGTYVWNEEDQTYESTTLGSPEKPKAAAVEPAYLREYTGADYGLTFEKDGLRARVTLQRAKAAP